MFVTEEGKIYFLKVRRDGTDFQLYGPTAELGCTDGQFRGCTRCPQTKSLTVGDERCSIWAGWGYLIKIEHETWNFLNPADILRLSCHPIPKQ